MNLLPAYLIILLFFLGSSPALVEGNNGNSEIFNIQPENVQLGSNIISAKDLNQENCKFKDIPLYAKVKFVESFGDIKIKFVESFPDIKVKFVTSFPNDCGKWQVVESIPDFTVHIVESFPDLKVKTVDSFPGMD